MNGENKYLTGFDVGVDDCTCKAIIGLNGKRGIVFKSRATIPCPNYTPVAEGTDEAQDTQTEYEEGA